MKTIQSIKRIICLALTAALLVSVCSISLAAGITVTCSDAKADNGTAVLYITVENNSGASITVNTIEPVSNNIQMIGDLVPLDIAGYVPDDPIVIAAGATVRIKATAVLFGDAATGSNEKVTVYFRELSDPVESGAFKLTVPAAPSAAPEDTVGNSPRLSRVDAYGNNVPAPSGDYGDTIKLRLPLTCNFGYIHTVTVTPVISGELDSFPFEVTLVDYSITYNGSISEGSVTEFDYDLTLSKKVTAGIKKVDFTVTYYDCNGAFQTTTLSVFVNVKRGVAASGGEGAATATPRVIISGYKVDVEQVYAGEPFTVTFEILNTSSSESVSNIQMKVTDAANAVLPVSGGSNTVYISKIGKGETHTESIALQTAADAEARAYTLDIAFAYEGASTLTAYTANETVTIPVAQRIRLKLDDPVIYDEAFVGQSCAMYVALYNLGRSTVSNCMLDVEGEGLTMEESYFGGNISSGGNMSADFNVIPSVAGEIQGNVLIIYEDSLGAQYTEKLPFTLYVNEEMIYEDPMVNGEFEVMEPQSTFPWWIVIAGVVLAGGAVLLIVLLKRRKARQLEDIQNAEDTLL